MLSHFAILVLSGIAAALNYNKPLGYEMCKYRCSQIYGCRTCSFCPMELLCLCPGDRDHVEPECQEKQTFILDGSELHGFLSDVSTNLSCPMFSRIIRNRRNSVQCVTLSLQAPRAPPGFLVAQKDASYGMSNFRIVDLEESKEIATNIQATHVTAFVYASSIQKVIMSLGKPANIMSYPLNGVEGVVIKRNLKASNMAVDDNKGFLFLTLCGNRNGVVRISLNNHEERVVVRYAVYHGIALDTIKGEIYLCRTFCLVRITYNGFRRHVSPLIKKDPDTLAFDPTKGVLFYSKGKIVFEKSLTSMRQSHGRVLIRVSQELKSLIFKDGVFYITYNNRSNYIGAIDISNRKFSVVKRLNYKVTGVLNICLFP